jgi:hypothetical protein
MSYDFNPVAVAIRRLLQHIGPQFSSTEAGDWTDAERVAVARLLNAGLIEVEYRISLSQEEKHRACVVTGRLSGGAAKPNEILGEAVIAAGLAPPGGKIDAHTLVSLDITRWRLTYNGELAASDLTLGGDRPIGWALENHPPRPTFVVVEVEPTTINASAESSAPTGEGPSVRVSRENQVTGDGNGRSPAERDSDIIAAESDEGASPEIAGTQVPQDGSEVTSVNDPASGTITCCDDPITLEQAAALVQVAINTIYNRRTEDRPKPIAVAGGRSPLVFSYCQLRPWLLEKFPSSAHRLPVDYEAARQLWT